MKKLIKFILLMVMVILIAMNLLGCTQQTAPAPTQEVTEADVKAVEKAETTASEAAASEITGGGTVASEAAVYAEAADETESVKTPTAETAAEETVAETETAAAAVAEETRIETETAAVAIDESGSYYDVENVVLYLHTYGRLPDNYITKKEAKALGWEGGSVETVAPDKAIGGDHYGNYEGRLPDAAGREYHECDIDTHNYKNRGSRRLIYSDDGAYYYTGDHYESFRELYVTDEGIVKWK